MPEILANNAASVAENNAKFHGYLAEGAHALIRQKVDKGTCLRHRI